MCPFCCILKCLKQKFSKKEKEIPIIVSDEVNQKRWELGKSTLFTHSTIPESLHKELIQKYGSLEEGLIHYGKY